MSVIILFVLIIVTILILKRNRFLELKGYVDQCKSNVNTAWAKCVNASRSAVGLAGKAGQNEMDRYLELEDRQNIKATDLTALGQRYPRLNDNFASSSALSAKLYDDYMNAQQALNYAITQYNVCVQSFPNIIFALILGFKKEELIAENMLNDSLRLTVNKEVDVDRYV